MQLYRLVYLYSKLGRLSEALSLAGKIVNTKEKISSEITKNIKTEMQDYIDRNKADSNKSY